MGKGSFIFDQPKTWRKSVDLAEIGLFKIVFLSYEHQKKLNSIVLLFRV